MIPSPAIRSTARARSAPMRLGRGQAARCVVAHPADVAAAAFLIGREKARQPVELGLFRPGLCESLAAPDAPCVFLGLEGERALFALDISAARDPGERGTARRPRPFPRRARRGATLPMKDAAIMGQAKAMIDWHNRHGFCAQLRRAHGTDRCRLSPRICDAMQGGAFSAHRSGRDHARRARRCLPRRTQQALSGKFLFGARGLHGAGRDASRKRCAAN